MATTTGTFHPGRRIIPQESPEGQELAKWEIRDRNAFGLMPLTKAEGGRYPYEFAEYPMMVYKAERALKGSLKIEIVDSLVVDSPEQRAAAERQGFYQGQDVAIAKAQAQELEAAKLEGNRHYHEQRMSEKAKVEADAFDSSTMRHEPEVPETPIRRRVKKESA